MQAWSRACGAQAGQAEAAAAAAAHPPPPAHSGLRLGPPTQAPTALFRYLPSRAGGDWEEVASNATLELFDANEDSNKKAPEWHLEVDGAQVRRGAAAQQTGPGSLPMLGS